MLLGSAAVAYICGWCSRENEFKPNDELRCIKCGYRIFYKKKLREGMQYEAR
jgi:DNA-directed RNA polymerase subunit RPC12/RpoP